MNLIKPLKIVGALFALMLVADLFFNQMGWETASFFTITIVYPLLVSYHFLLNKKIEIRVNRSLFLAHFFGFVAIWIRSVFTLTELFIIIVQVALLIESQIIISTFRRKINLNGLKKYGLLAFTLVFVVSVGFIKLTFTENSIYLNVLLLIRIIQTGFLSIMAFAVLDKSKAFFFGVLFLAISNFTSGINALLVSFQYEYIFTIGSFYLGRFLLVKSYAQMSKMEISDYINRYRSA